MHALIHGKKKVCVLHRLWLNGASLNKTETYKTNVSWRSCNLKHDILVVKVPKSPSCSRFMASGAKCGVHCRVSFLTLRLWRLIHNEISTKQLHPKLRLQVVLRVLGQQNDGESCRNSTTGVPHGG